MKFIGHSTGQGSETLKGVNYTRLRLIFDTSNTKLSKVKKVMPCIIKEIADLLEENSEFKVIKNLPFKITATGILEQDLNILFNSSTPKNRETYIKLFQEIEKKNIPDRIYDQLTAM